MKLHLIPGVLAALGVMVAGYWLADALGRARLPHRDSPAAVVRSPVFQ